MVIFIITLLLMIMSPFMGSARESALNTLCQNNLEKLSTALRTTGSGSSLVTKNAGKGWGKLPDAWGWIAAASGSGGQTVLKCPKGYYEGTSGNMAVQPNVVLREPPMSAVFDAPVPDIEDDKIIWGWTERMNYVLPRAISVDISEPGFYEKDHGRTRKTIPAGTMINSYCLHYDVVGRKRKPPTSGIVSFGSEILGVIVLSESHDAVDDVLGAPGTTYHTGRKSRGFEGNGQDAVTLKDDMRTLVIDHLLVSSPGEDIRILTRPEGEASYAMNELVNPNAARPSQLLLLEYNKMVANPTKDDLEVEMAPRHFGRVNTLRVNGSVSLMYPEDLEKDELIWQPEWSK